MLLVVEKQDSIHWWNRPLLLLSKTYSMKAHGMTCNKSDTGLMHLNLQQKKKIQATFVSPFIHILEKKSSQWQVAVIIVF